MHIELAGHDAVIPQCKSQLSAPSPPLLPRTSDPFSQESISAVLAAGRLQFGGVFFHSNVNRMWGNCGDALGQIVSSSSVEFHFTYNKFSFGFGRTLTS